MKRQTATAPEREFALPITESELSTLVSALEYLERRQLFLAKLANNQGREKEAQARIESSGATVKLAEKLYAIGAKP
jgi:hypothetical protein